MSTKRSAGPGVPTQEKVRPAAARKKDRSTNLCAFTFADGRQCRTPRCSGHLHLCYFHAQKEAERLAAKQVGEDISRFLPAKLLTACDLSGAMARVFCAIARGDVKPKLASTLAYLSQSMVQCIPIARHEYCEAFGLDSWRREIRSSFNVPAPQPKPAPQPTPKLAPKPEHSAPVAASPSSPVCHPEHSEGSHPAPATQFAPPVVPATQTPVNCHSERSDERPTSGASPESYREEPASSSNSSLATHPSPLPQPPSQPAPASPAPPPVPPGFGAPANWDVLIPPKPRRRFSRHWQLLE